MKKRRFADGGQTFSPEQEAWLGGADRTDPYILARMRRAVPDRAPVEDRTPTPVEEVKARSTSEADNDTADMKRSAVSMESDERSDIADMKRSASRVAAAPAPAAPQRRPSYSGTGGSGGGRGATAAEMRRGSGGGRGPTAAELEAYRSSQKPTREQLISQIPTGGSGAGPTPSQGNSASGSELGRNIKNTLSALSGYQGVNLAKAAAEGATARAAAARMAERAAEASKKSERAGVLRRGAKPTKFESPAKPSRTRATKKFNEDEANVEFRRGGKTQAYAKGGMVKGWGQARGARAAKIV